MKSDFENVKKYKNRIAMTGGRGRLAGSIASFLTRQGYEIVLFSRRGGEGFQVLEELFNPQLMATFGTLIHTAWSTVPFTSQEHHGQEERNDLPLLEQLLTSTTHARAWESSPRLLFFSSASVYGNTTQDPVSETAPTHPLSRYAQAKLTAENMILQRSKSDPFVQPLIFRITNVLGILSNPNFPQGILPRIIAAAKRQEPLPIWGDGLSSKDYLWIDDLLGALEAALRTSLSGVFNLGSGEQCSLLDLISIVEQSLHVSIPLEYHDHYTWDVASCFVDSSKFSKATGWIARCDLREKIKELLQ